MTLPALSANERAFLTRTRTRVDAAERFNPVTVSDLLAIIDRLSPGVAEPPTRCRHSIYHAGCPSCDESDPESRPLADDINALDRIAPPEVSP